MNTMTMVLKPQELLGQQFEELNKFLFEPLRKTPLCMQTS